jgi:hypothetical protein
MTKRGKVLGLFKRPSGDVTPFNSCVACHHSATTAVFFEGSARFVVAGLTVVAGMPMGEAEAKVRVAWHEKYGTDPGMVPNGRLTEAARLCRACAAKTGLRIAEIPAEAGAEVPAYREEMPDGLIDGEGEDAAD